MRCARGYPPRDSTDRTTTTARESRSPAVIDAGRTYERTNKRTNEPVLSGSFPNQGDGARPEVRGGGNHPCCRASEARARGGEKQGAWLARKQRRFYIRGQLDDTSFESRPIAGSSRRNSQRWTQQQARWWPTKKKGKKRHHCWQVHYKVVVTRKKVKIRPTGC